jgi:putative component of membrane protein insertase Oxa1/YidC/SpoIIIJ protein YidD
MCVLFLQRSSSWALYVGGVRYAYRIERCNVSVLGGVESMMKKNAKARNEKGQEQPAGLSGRD